MKYFPLAIILLFIGATIEAAIHRNWRDVIFYAASAAINLVKAF